MLYKAHRINNIVNAHESIAPILKTLTYDGDTWRRRDIREGEQVESAWDELLKEDSPATWLSTCGEKSKEMPKHLAYNEADALEEAVLFSNEADNKRFAGIESEVAAFEAGRLEKYVMRYFLGLDDMRDDYLEDLDPSGDDESDDGWITEGDDDSVEEEEEKTAPHRAGRASYADPRTLAKLPNVNKAEKILDSFGPGPSAADLDLNSEFMMCVDMYKAKGKRPLLLAFPPPPHLRRRRETSVATDFAQCSSDLGTSPPPSPHHRRDGANICTSSPSPKTTSASSAPLCFSPRRCSSIWRITRTCTRGC